MKPKKMTTPTLTIGETLTSNPPDVSDRRPLAILSALDERERTHAAFKRERPRLELALVAGGRLQEIDGELVLVTRFDRGTLEHAARYAAAEPVVKAGPVGGAFRYATGYPDDSPAFGTFGERLELVNAQPWPEPQPLPLPPNAADLAAALTASHDQGLLVGFRMGREGFEVRPRFGDSGRSVRVDLIDLSAEPSIDRRDVMRAAIAGALERALETVGWPQGDEACRRALAQLEGDVATRNAILSAGPDAFDAWLEAMRRREATLDAAALREVDLTSDESITRWALTPENMRAASVAWRSIQPKPAPKSRGIDVVAGDDGRPVMGEHVSPTGPGLGA